MRHVPPRAMREVFGSDHAALEALFTELTAAFDANATLDCTRLWAALDERLRRHMDLEERELLPRLALTDGAEATSLRREHDELRRLLLSLGVGVDLHTTRADTVTRFVDLLRAHARREDALLYRWADETLPADERGSLAQRIQSTSPPTTEPTPSR